MPLGHRVQLDAGYQVLVFDAPEPMQAEAGQFAMVRSPDWGASPLLPRPMSLLGAGAEPSILIKVVGEGTRRMAEAPLGARFTLLGPLGRGWALPPADTQPMLVAGGVGVAPLVYLAEKLVAIAHRAGGGRAPLVTLYGGRTVHDLPLAERLEANGELEVSTEDGSRGVRGRVTVLVERALDNARAEGRPVVLYACGPHGMMAAVAEIAARFGVTCHASLEAPMGCGYGVCLGCAVAKRNGGFLYTCVEGPCVDATSIDWKSRVF